MTAPLLRNISDTARWVAVYRALETSRPDALFRDPFAHRLAGDRGRELAKVLGRRGMEWPFVVRTLLFDQFITESIQAGCDLVLNLAAGLDARPYRMPLPPALQWVEVDLPEIINEKEAILRDEKPVCSLDRVRLDLADIGARRALFDDVGRRAKRVLVLSEGLVIYLSEAEVAGLAEDLARPAAIHSWVLEVASPGLLRMMQRQLGTELEEAGAPFKFGPAQGPDFFIPHGWRAVDIRSSFKTAGGLGRLPWYLKLASMLPEKPGPKGSRPWAGICRLEKTAGP